MDSKDIISSMVKSRECCRRLVHNYEAERNRRLAAPAEASDVVMLQSANRTATQILTHLSSLPARPCSAMDEDSRRYTSKVLGDIRTLLEKAIMLEREMRTTAPTTAESSGPEAL
ncbi:MAG: hypothetical protein WCR06_02325 [bacterium]